MHPAVLYQSTKGHKTTMGQSYFVIQGWGLLSYFRPFRYFLNFSSLSKHSLTVKYRVYIWRVLTQLGCGDTCQIWMWCEHNNMFFCKIKYLLTEKLTNGALATPIPGIKNPQVQSMGMLSLCLMSTGQYLDMQFVFINLKIPFLTSSHNTIVFGQQHRITVYRTGLGVRWSGVECH